MALSWPAQLLALHEVEHRHERPRDGRIKSAVGGLEDDSQQAPDQSREFRSGLRRSQSLLTHMAAKSRQSIQRIQQVCDTRQQPGPARSGSQVHVLQMAAQLQFTVFGVVAELVQCVQPLWQRLAQVDVGPATLLLQVVNELADQRHQFARRHQLLEAFQFSPPRRQHESQGGGQCVIID